MLAPPFDVLGKTLSLVGRAFFAPCGRWAAAGAVLEAQRGVDGVAQLPLILLGNAEQHADHAHRHLRSKVRDEVDAVASDQWVEARRTVGPHLGLELRDPAGSEETGQQGA